MNLIYIFWGNYGGFLDVLACAQARAKCPIFVVSDGPPPPPGHDTHHLPISRFPRVNRMRSLFESRNDPDQAVWLAKTMTRWFILQELTRRHPGMFPLFCSDWDILLFSNLNDAYRPFLAGDISVTKDGSMGGPAYGINNAEALDKFCSHIEKLVVDRHPLAHNLNDMVAWGLAPELGLRVSDLSQVVNGGVFDHNIHCDGGVFEMDGPTKRIVFGQQQPFFVTKAGEQVKAHCIHCWGSYKGRTAELRRQAGV
jgi:hypothetical protein